MNYSTGEKEYPSNSHKSQAAAEETTPKKEITSVVTGNVTKSKRKSFSHALTDIFMKEDLVSVKDYVLDEVVKPMIKDGIYSVVSNGLSMFLYGTPAAGSRIFGRASGSSKGSLGKLDYTSYSKQVNDNGSRRSVRSNVNDYETLYFESMADADQVLIKLFDIFEQYHMVSVAEFYMAAGESSTPADNNWGWDNLDTRNTYVVKDGREYYIHLPRIKPIN